MNLGIFRRLFVVGRLWYGYVSPGPGVVNLKLCQGRLSRHLLAASLMVFGCVYFLPHTHLTLSKYKFAQVGLAWYLDLVSVRKSGHRENQSSQPKVSLQRENMFMYKREKRGGPVMIPPEIKINISALCMTNGVPWVLNVMLPTCESLDCISRSHLTSA